MRRLLVACALIGSGCYQAQQLDEAALLAELRSSTRAGRVRSPSDLGTAPPAALSVDEAVAEALRGNPELRVLRHARGVADGEIVTARALANPTLDFQLLHLQNLAAGQLAWSIGLTWEPPQPAVFAARGGVARAGAQVVRAEIAELEIQLAAAVRAAHAGLLAIDEQRQIVAQGIALRRRLRGLVEQRVAGGASTRIELGLAELSVTQLERDLDELLARRIDAERQLADLLGAAPPLEVVGVIPDREGLPDGEEQLDERAVSALPATTAARARFAQREQRLRLEHARRWPWFRLTALPRYRANDTLQNPSDFSVGAELVLPVLDWNRGPIQVAEATRDQERERFRGVLLSIRRDLASARAEITLRQSSLLRYRTRVLPAIAEQERLLAAAAAGGQIDLVAVLSAEDAILRSRREYGELRLAHHRAWLALDRALGRTALQPKEDQ